MKKVYEIALQFTRNHCILSPPTQTHDMSNQPFYRAFPLFCDAIADALITRNSFNAKWFISESGIQRMTQVYNEGMPFDISVSELETWCKGWTNQNNQ